MWKCLIHPNILPLLGVTLTPPQLVLSWMSSGDLLEYIKEHPDVDQLGLVGGPTTTSILHLLLLPAIWSRQGPLLPPLLQRDSWGPQGSTWIFDISLHCIDTRSAKHHCG